MKNEISISLSKEHEKYIPEIVDTFKWLNVKINPDIYRFSSWELAIQIILYIGWTILSWVTYDLLKEWIKRFYSKFSNSSALIDSNIWVKFLVNKDLTVKAIVIPERENEFENIKNIEDLLNYINKQDLITKSWYKFIPHIWEIPEDWEVNNLSKICNFYKWKWLSKDDLLEKWWLYECIHYGELFRWYWEKISNINFTTNYNDNPFFSGNNDVLMPTSDITPNWLATASSIKKEWVVLWWDILVIRLKEDLDWEYFSFFVSWNKKQIMRLVSWTTVFHLYAKDMEVFNIAYPKNKSEQNKILKILNNANYQIETTKQIIQKIELRNKGLQQQLLTWKKRLPWFSEKWTRKKLWDEILYFWKKSTINDEYEVLTSSKSGLITQKEYYWDSRLTTRENIWFNIIPSWFITYRSRSDDWIFTFNINKYDFTWIVSKYYPVFSSKSWSNIFLVKYLNLFASKIGSFAIWTSQLVLWLKELNNIHLILPGDKEQKAIADILDKATEQLNEYKEKLEKLELQKKGLMQQLLTGKTRVKV